MAPNDKLEAPPRVLGERHQEERATTTTKATGFQSCTRNIIGMISDVPSTPPVSMNHPERGPSPATSPNESVQREPELPDSDDASSEEKRSRCRMLFTGEQLERLRHVFKDCKYPKATERMQLAQSLGVSHKSVKQWFQNARSKLKKRGTDHVTGFYANKLAARQVTLPDSSVVFQYGRFKISGARSGDREPSTDGRPQEPIASSPETNEIHESSTSTAGSDSERSWSKDSTTRASPGLLETSVLSRWTRDKCARGPSPSTTEEESEDTAVSHPTARKQLHLSPPSAGVLLSGFQKMQQVSLPADHPFCNLGNPEFVWPERCRRSPSPQTAAVACDKEHDSTEPCLGQTHDDILAEYLKAITPPDFPSSAHSSPDSGSPASTASNLLGVSRLSASSCDDTPRAPHAAGLKRRKLSSDSYYSSEPSRVRLSIDADDDSDVPLDLSMKGKRKRQDENTATKDEQLKLFHPYPLKFSPSTAVDKVTATVFHPLAACTPVAYPLPFHPFGLMPLRIPGWY